MRKKKSSLKNYFKRNYKALKKQQQRASKEEVDRQNFGKFSTRDKLHHHHLLTLPFDSCGRVRILLLQDASLSYF